MAISKSLKFTSKKNQDDTEKSGMFEKTSIKQTLLGLPKNSIIIGIIIIFGVIGLIVRMYLRNAKDVNEMTQNYANSI